MKWRWKSLRNTAMRLTSGLLLAACAVCVAYAAAPTAPRPGASAEGDYTAEQAQHGAHVFAVHCAQCHGAQLQGGQGPTLAGAGFKDTLELSKMSASQLFDFISTQMPYNAPGSLSKVEYVDVMAFILHKNGYPAGSKPLGPELFKSVKLLPYPSATHASPGSSD